MAYNTLKISVFLLFLRSMRCTSDAVASTTEPDYTSVKPPPLNDTADLARLYKALNDRCEDEYGIIDILVERTNSQRQKLLEMASALHDTNLTDMIVHRFIGDTKRAVTALITPSEQFYAKELFDSIDGLGTDETAISEILTSMNNSEIAEINAVYRRTYGVPLQDDLTADTSGAYRKLVVALSEGKRSENDTIDADVILKDAIAMNSASKAMESEKNCEILVEMFTTRSLKQLRATFEEYGKISPNSVMWTIIHQYDANMDLQYGLLSIVKNVFQERNDYFAVQLAESMATPWTDDHKLTRIIVGRAEIDLDCIQNAYKHIYGTRLVDKIAFETGGAYGYLLLAIANKAYEGKVRLD